MSEVGRTDTPIPRATKHIRQAGGDNSTSATIDRQQETSGRTLPDDRLTVAEDEATPLPRTADNPLTKALSVLNDYAQSTQRDLEFLVDAELGRAVVQVVDRASGEVIRQIPDSVALNLARNLQANLEQLELSRTARQAGVEHFVSAETRLGFINTRA